jgi:hypothetical protein
MAKIIITRRIIDFELEILEIILRIKGNDAPISFSLTTD